MKHRRLSLIVLLYWGLLINLGPSLHTLSFLGLHDHSCCSVVEVQVSDAQEFGCCGGSHCHTTPQSPLTPEVASAEVKASHDCPLCKFFDLYQADFTQLAEYVPSEKVETFCLRSGPSFSHESISCRARGPPAV